MILAAKGASNGQKGTRDLAQSIGVLARNIQQLAREALHQYGIEVRAILKAQTRDSRRIERCLDGMLDFCFDDGMLVLYKKLCRYYFDIDPEAVVSYVHAYREMWDEQSPSSISIKFRDGFDKPRSRMQRYRTTEKGLAMLRET